jgi:predicted short-subunit dehydrogenase-like oxidoreductase (DUF2520 family)
MIRVVLLGGGNLAFHLAKAMQKSARIDLVQIYNRSEIYYPFLENSTHYTERLSDLMPADIYVICVSDNAVEELANSLNINNVIVVHTSGNLAMNVLSKHKRTGVLYPVQSFSKGTAVDFKRIPICIEASNEQDEILLLTLAQELSEHCTVLSSEKRQQLHLAAVFVNNFVNHLYHIADTLCQQNQISFDLLRPLINTTVAKIMDLTPYDAQTGPARRNDSNTIEAHLELLDIEQQHLYQSLTQSIQKTYGNQL